MSSILPWNDPDIPDEKRKEELEKKILELTLKKWSRPRIMKETGVSITTIWKIRKKLVVEGKLLKNPKGQIIASKSEKKAEAYKELLSSDFAQIKSVQNMIFALQKSRKNFDDVVKYFYKVCKTVNRHPDEFLQKETDITLFKDEFIDKFEKGEAFYLDKSNARKYLNQEETSPEEYLKSIKAFRRTNGIPMSRGFLSIHKKTSGKYARIRLSDSQRKLGIVFFGAISTLMKNLFILQNEIGVRINTLVGMKAYFERHSIDIDGKPCEFFTTTVFEVKQEDARSGGRYDKIIFSKEARELVRPLKEGDKIFNITTSERQLQEEYNEHLRRFYASIGKIDQKALLPKNDPNRIKYKKGIDEYYYILMPSHVIRHSCVHWLLRCTDNDANAVASMFWDTPQMLNDFYARKSAIESLLEEGKCDYCTPQTYPDQNWNKFCRFTHALAWANYEKTQNQLKSE